MFIRLVKVSKIGLRRPRPRSLSSQSTRRIPLPLHFRHSLLPSTSSISSFSTTKSTSSFSSHIGSDEEEEEDEEEDDEEELSDDDEEEELLSDDDEVEIEFDHFNTLNETPNTNVGNKEMAFETETTPSTPPKTMPRQGTNRTNSLRAEYNPEKVRRIGNTMEFVALQPDVIETDTIWLPSKQIGWVIGENGATIQSIEAATHCAIQTDSNKEAEQREITLVGNAAQVHMAKIAINKHKHGPQHTASSKRVVVNFGGHLRKGNKFKQLSKGNPKFLKKVINKSAFITGGTGGLGSAMCKHLLQDGFNVTFVSRNIEKGNQLIEHYQKTIENCPEIVCMKLDLLKLQDVHAFGKKFAKFKQPLDLISFHAGTMNESTFIKTEDGLESQYQLNHLSNLVLVRIVFIFFDIKYLTVTDFFLFFSILVALFVTDHDVGYDRWH